MDDAKRKEITKFMFWSCYEHFMRNIEQSQINTFPYELHFEERAFAQKIIHSTYSLLNAIDEAGGRVRKETLMEMSLLDFIPDISASNMIEFRYYKVPKN